MVSEGTDEKRYHDRREAAGRGSYECKRLGKGRMNEGKRFHGFVGMLEPQAGTGSTSQPLIGSSLYIAFSKASFVHVLQTSRAHCKYYWSGN